MTTLVLVAWWRDDFRMDAAYWAALWIAVWLDVTIAKVVL